MHLGDHRSARGTIEHESLDDHQRSPSKAEFLAKPNARFDARVTAIRTKALSKRRNIRNIHHDRKRIERHGLQSSLVAKDGAPKFVEAALFAGTLKCAGPEPRELMLRKWEVQQLILDRCPSVYHRIQCEIQLRTEWALNVSESNDSKPCCGVRPERRRGQPVNLGLLSRCQLASRRGTAGPCGRLSVELPHSEQPDRRQSRDRDHDIQKTISVHREPAPSTALKSGSA